MRSFSTVELLTTLPTVVSILRDPINHGDELRPRWIDCADGEVRALCWCAHRLDLSVEGIPFWRVGGRVKGASPRTRIVHLRWIAEDVADRLPLDDSKFHEALWRARLASISSSSDAGSVMSGVRDDQLADELDQFRAEGFSAPVAL